MGRILTRTPWRTRSHQAPHKKPNWPFVFNRQSPQAIGLRQWYPFSPGKGDILFNLAGTSFGRITDFNNGPLWKPNPYTGVPGLRCDGTDDYVNFGNLNTFTGLLNYSLTLWFSVNAAPGVFDNIVGKELVGSNFPEFRLIQLNDAVEYFHHHEDAGTAAGVSGGDLSTWVIDEPHLCVVTYSNIGGTRLLTLYLDGVEVDTAVPSGEIWDGSSNLFLAAADDASLPSGPADMTFHDLRFYTTTLPAATVRHMWDPQTRWDLYYELGRVFYSVPAVVAVGNPWHVYAQQ